MKNLLLLALILIVSACNSDDTITLTPDPIVPEVTTNGIHLLKKIFRNGELYNEFIYTSDSILIQIDRTSNGVPIGHTQYVYLSDTIRTIGVAGDGFWTGSVDTYKLPDDMIGVDRRNDYGLNHSRRIYENDQCSHSKLETFFSDCTTIKGTTERIYTDNCSYLSTSYNSDMEVTATIEVTRDDQSVYTHSLLNDMLDLDVVYTYEY